MERSPDVGITPLTDAQIIEAAPFPDWVVVAQGRAWITGVEKGVAVYDSHSGLLLGGVELDGELCGRPVAAFGSIWLPACGVRRVFRVDARLMRVTASLAIDVPDTGEFTIGADDDSVWAVADHGPDECELVRIDPASDTVTATIPLPKDAVCARAAFGAVWVACPGSDRVLRLDPELGRLVADIETGVGPRFMDVGEGAVWIMNQVEGSVSRVDPVENMVVATIPVEDQAIDGGDLTVGEGSVWMRTTSKQLVAQIDPSTNEVVRRYGEPEGSGSASAGDGQLWISAHDANRVYRLPLN